MPLADLTAPLRMRQRQRLFLKSVTHTNEKDKNGGGCGSRQSRAHTNTAIPILPSLRQNTSVRCNRHHLPWDRFIAALHRFFCRSFQTTAARNLHAYHSNTAYFILLQYLRQFFTVIHGIQLRAANQCNFSFHKRLMHSCKSKSRAVCGNQQIGRQSPSPSQ